jgi:Excalibur calcium-binding domain
VKPKRKQSPSQIEHNGVLYRRMQHLDQGPAWKWWRYFPRVLATRMFMVAGMFAVLFLLHHFTQSNTNEWRASNAFQAAPPPNCATARALGLDNARRGQPGYAAHLDRDGDGIACEPYYGRNRW